jgi:hypothetical protein
VEGVNGFQFGDVLEELFGGVVGLVDGCKFKNHLIGG